MDTDNWEFVTGRGEKKLLYEGFMYTKDKLNQEGTVQFWRCTNRSASCLARLHTRVEDGAVLKMSSEHNHEPYTREEIEAKKAYALIKRVAATTTDNASELRDMVLQSMPSVTPSASVKLPSLGATRQMIKRARVRSGLVQPSGPGRKRNYAVPIDQIIRRPKMEVDNGDWAWPSSPTAGESGGGGGWGTIGGYQQAHKQQQPVQPFAQMAHDTFDALQNAGFSLWAYELKTEVLQCVQKYEGFLFGKYHPSEQRHGPAGLARPTIVPIVHHLLHQQMDDQRGEEDNGIDIDHEYERPGALGNVVGTDEVDPIG